MVEKILSFDLGFGSQSEENFYLTGLFSSLAVMAFGFIVYGLILFGMMLLLWAIEHHPAAIHKNKFIKPKT